MRESVDLQTSFADLRIELKLAGGRSTAQVAGVVVATSNASPHARSVPLPGDYDAEPRIGHHVDADRSVRWPGDLKSSTCT